jgi:hypothetical protein
MTISVVAGTDPEEREGVVVVELPRHLADLLSLPVAVRELPHRPRACLPRGSGDSGTSWRRLLLLRRHPGASLPPPHRICRNLAAGPAGVAAGSRGQIPGTRII